MKVQAVVIDIIIIIYILETNKYIQVEIKKLSTIEYQTSLE